MKLLGLLGVWLWLGAVLSGVLDAPGQERALEKARVLSVWEEKALGFEHLGPIFEEGYSEAWLTTGSSDSHFLFAAPIDAASAPVREAVGMLSAAEPPPGLCLLLATGHRAQAPPVV